MSKGLDYYSNYRVSFTDKIGNPHESSPCIFVANTGLGIPDIAPLIDKELSEEYSGYGWITSIEQLPYSSFLIEGESK